MTVEADFSRIKTLLQLTGLQQKDNRLYQVIHDLIRAVEQQQAYTNQQIDTIASADKSTNITNQILGFLEDSSQDERILATPTSLPPNLTGLFANEVPTGSIDGSNKVFTTARNYVAGTLEVYLNGVRQEITLDYTETAANQFTFVDAPLAGDTVLVDYGTTLSALKGDTGAGGIQGATGPAGVSAANIPPQDGADGEQSFIPGPKGDKGDIGITGPPLGLFLQDGADGDVLLVPGPKGLDGAVDSTAALVYRSNAQTIPRNIETAISFDATLFDASSFWSVGSPTRLTVPSGKGGKYIIVGQVSWTLAGTGSFNTHLYKNGTKIADTTYAQTTSDASLQVCVVADLAVGDYIELKTIVDTGIANEPTQGGSNETFLALALCTGNSAAVAYTAGTGISIVGTTISSTVSSGLVLLESHTATNAAAFLDFTTRNATGQSGDSFQSDYDEYILDLVGLYPSANATGIYAWLRFITSGPTVQTTAYRYARTTVDNAGATAAGGSGANTATVGGIPIATDLRINAGTDPQYSQGLNGSFRTFSPLSTVIHKAIFGHTDYNISTGTGNQRSLANNAGWWCSFTAAIGIRVLFDNAFLNTPYNIAAGTARLYGVAK